MRCCITVACLFLAYESCFMLIGMILGLKRYVLQLRSAPVRDDSNIPDRNMFIMTICRICGKHCIGSGIWQRFSRLGLSSPAMAIDSSQTGEA